MGTSLCSWVGRQHQLLTCLSALLSVVQSFSRIPIKTPVHMSYECWQTGFHVCMETPSTQNNQLKQNWRWVLPKWRLSGKLPWKEETCKSRNRINNTETNHTGKWPLAKEQKYSNGGKGAFSTTGVEISEYPYTKRKTID